MTSLLRTLMLSLLLFAGFSLKAFPDTIGHIQGTLSLDNTWERTIYLSSIETIEREYAVSKDMIVASSSIDSLGQFSVSLKSIPVTWSLLRLHVVKKEAPAASLIIGGVEENHYFLVANRFSKINLQNKGTKPIFDQITITGAPYMKTFELVKKLADYSSSLEYENSLIEKEFMEEVVAEKLKLIADTCKNPLVSLYTLYQTNFNVDFQKNPAFYESYLAKWDDVNSSHFKSFRQQFPSSNLAFVFYILLVVVAVIVVVGVLRMKIKDTKI